MRCMPSAVSSRASVTLLTLLGLIRNLLDFTVQYGSSQVWRVHGKQPGCNFASRFQFVRRHVVLFILGECQEKGSTICSAVGEHHAIATGAPFAAFGNALLDESTTEF